MLTTRIGPYAGSRKTEDSLRDYVPAPACDKKLRACRLRSRDEAFEAGLNEPGSRVGHERNRHAPVGASDSDLDDGPLDENMNPNVDSAGLCQCTCCRKRRAAAAAAAGTADDDDELPIENSMGNFSAERAGVRADQYNAYGIVPGPRDIPPGRLGIALKANGRGSNYLEGPADKTPINIAAKINSLDSLRAINTFNRRRHGQKG